VVHNHHVRSGCNGATRSRKRQSNTPRAIRIHFVGAAQPGSLGYDHAVQANGCGLSGSAISVQGDDSDVSDRAEGVLRRLSIQSLKFHRIP
jgi:hypothetical protein